VNERCLTFIIITVSSHVKPYRVTLYSPIVLQCSLYCWIIFILCRSTKTYGSDGQRFDHLTFLNLTQCLMCFLWSFLSELTFLFPVFKAIENHANWHTFTCDVDRLHPIVLELKLHFAHQVHHPNMYVMVVVLKIWPGEPGTEAPILAYWACSVSNTIGPACGILALKYISYPAQVLYCKWPNQRASNA
jgi:hypothetical protein